MPKALLVIGDAMEFPNSRLLREFIKLLESQS